MQKPTGVTCETGDRYRDGRRTPTGFRYGAANETQHAASINDWDYGLLLGASLVGRMMSGLFKPRVKILGCDIAGRVEAVGEGVEAFQLGDEVYGDLSASGFGAFAEYVCVPAANVARSASTSTRNALAVASWTFITERI